MWLRLDGPPLPRPLMLAAVYLPPYRSKYGCKSPADLADYFTLLGDEVAAAASVPGGADILVGGDLNAHTGSLQDSADHSALLQAALDDDSGELLLPCAALATAVEAPRRASSCTAAVCEQGRAVLHFCESTGMLIANGRVQGDLQGSPTFHSGAVIDYLLTSPGLFMQAAELRVLEPVPEYQQHRPLELRLAPAASQPGGTADQRADPESEGCGPPPTFAAPLRLTPDGLSSFANELAQPATAAALQHLAATASNDPLLAASQLHSVIYDTAAAVFPTASTAPRLPHSSTSTSRQLRRRHQPWFDAECEAARQRIRLQMQASVTSGQPSHLAAEALRVVGNRYTRLRRRKAAGWQRRQGKALLQLQRTDSRAFYKRWKQQHPDNPIDARTWLRHFVNLQLKRKFKPTRRRASPSSPSSPAPAADPDCDPPSPPPDPTLDSDITPADVAASLRKLSPSSASLGPLKAALIQAGRDALTPVLARLFTAVFRAGCFPPLT
mgnify:CR=1 FL=1